VSLVRWSGVRPKSLLGHDLPCIQNCTLERDQHNWGKFNFSTLLNVGFRHFLRIYSWITLCHYITDTNRRPELSATGGGRTVLPLTYVQMDSSKPICLIKYLAYRNRRRNRTFLPNWLSVYVIHSKEMKFQCPADLVNRQKTSKCTEGLRNYGTTNILPCDCEYARSVLW
jgi:hypothetical protein